MRVYTNCARSKLVTFYYYSDRAYDGHGSVAAVAAVPRDTRPCVGIRYSLTGPRSCRNRRRHRRHYRYHYVCRSVCLPVGRSMGRLVGQFVGRSVGRTGRQLCVVQHLTASAEPSMWSDLPTTTAVGTDTTNIYSTATTIGARTRPGLTPPPPHLSLLHRAPEEEAPHSRVVARTRPTHPACPPVGHLGAWTVFGAIFFYFFYYYHLFICLFYYSYYSERIEVCI